MTMADLDQLCVNTIRTLSMDAVQRARSGHPGTPMAMAPVAYALWQRHLRFDPDDPIWPNRDRFVLSRRPARRDHRDAHLRKLGSARSAEDEVRVHPRTRRARRTR